MKKFIALLLVLSMSLTLFAGCKSNPGVESATPDGPSTASDSGAAPTAEAGRISVNLAMVSDANTLTPFGGSGAGRQTVRALLYEKIIYTNSDTHEVENWLAKDIVNKGGGVYEVTLYDYIHDSNGHPMTASDIVFSFEKAIEDGYAAANLSAMESCTATGDYTVEFQFSSMAVGVFEQAMNAVYCITEAGWEDSGDEMTATPVGTGCYVLEDYAVDSYYRFVKSEDYWQADPSLRAAISAQNADEITMKVITEASTRTIALETGEVDGSTVSEVDILNFADEDYNPKDGYVVGQLKTGNSYVLQFTCADPSPCVDINLRKAISYAIDTEALAYAMYGNLGRALYSIINDAWLDAGAVVNDGNYYPYDPDLAKEYLAQSSYSGETLVLVCPSGAAAMSTLLEAYLSAIGVNVEVQTWSRPPMRHMDWTTSLAGTICMSRSFPPCSTAGPPWSALTPTTTPAG